MASTHASANLLPEWLGILGAVMFLLIAGAHLGHLAMTHGERRHWHVLHVGMAIGMAFMYAPARIDPFAIQAEFWQFLFASAAALAALRWFAGYLGAAADNPLWLLTAIDLGAMVYMWSPGSFVGAMTWTLVAYLTVEAGLWVLNAYRVIDRGTPLIRWHALTPAPAAGAPLATTAVATDSLIGGLDISVSMTAMAVGMAYMLAVMQLMS
jgi:hypothetical protein